MNIQYKHWVDKKDYYVPSYHSESTRVQPDLSLSVAEIYERWRKNLPLDVVMRNGEFLPKSMTDEAAFEMVDDSHFDDITDERITKSIEQRMNIGDYVGNLFSNVSEDATTEGEAEGRQAAPSVEEQRSSE